MNSREKKLFAALVVVAIYAVGDFTYSYVSKKLTSKTTVAGPLARAREAVNQVQLRVAALPVKQRDQYAMLQAQTPLKLDPLRNLKSTTGNAFDRDYLPPVAYTGYIGGRRNAIAILNGQEFLLGDVMKASDEEVVEITESHVVLRQRVTGQKREIAIAVSTGINVMGKIN